MPEKPTVAILFDAAELKERDAAKDRGVPYPLVHEQVAETLTKRGYKVDIVPGTQDIKTLVNRIDKDGTDVLFNLCESVARLTKHEPSVAGLLELMGKTFTGSGAAGMTLAQDKALAKKIFQFHGLPYPRFSTIDAGHVEWSDDLRFPLFVKPLNEDASIGIDSGSVVRNVKELLERISHLHNTLSAPALVEEYIEGREIYVGVLGNDKIEALPVLEWDLSVVKEGPRIASAEAKWDRDSEAFKAPEVFPTDIPEAVIKKMQQTAIDAYRALKLSDYARVDMRLRRRGEGVEPTGGAADGDKTKTESAAVIGEKSKDAGNAVASSEKRVKNEPQGKMVGRREEDWEFFIIEVNPNPWLEKRSEFATAARKHGISYPDLLERIIDMAVVRHRREHLRQPQGSKIS